MSRRALAALFIGTLLPLLVATLPLRLAVAGDALAGLGVSATEATGSVWSGRLRAATWRGHPQGDVAVSLRPLSLLAGVRRLRLSAPALSLDLLQGRRSGFERADGQLELRLDAPMSGILALSFDDVRLVFGDGTCRQAGGRIEAQFTAEGLPGALRLAGSPACDDRRGRIVLSTQPASGALPVEVVVTTDAQGRYEVRALVRTTDDAFARALANAGFQPTPGGMARVQRGRFRH